MNRLVLWVSLFFCAMIQAVLPAWQGLGQAKAPLLLAAVIYYALSRNGSQFIEAAVLAGLLQDSLGPIPHGYSVIAFVSVALLVHHYRERVFAEHWYTHMMLGVGSSVLATFILYLLLVGSDLRNGVSFPFVLNKAFGMSLLSLVVVPAVYKSIDRLDHALGNVKRGEL